MAVRPDPTAYAHNRIGYQLYRARRFADARAAYQAALTVDPAFLAPRLNIACALVQEERFADAVTEASNLLRAGYVPWAKDVMEAADLAPLRIRPEFLSLRAALREAGAEWGAALFSSRPALPFIARTGPPVALQGTGVLVLSPAQEIFAYLPAQGRYRQLTAEDGRVLAFAASPDRRTLVYVRGSKLIRSSGQPDRLRGLVVRRLALPDMTLGPPVALAGDVHRLELTIAAPTPSADASADARIEVQVEAGAPQAFLFDGMRLLPAPAPHAASDSGASGAVAKVVLTGAGVLGTERSQAASSTAGCAFLAHDKPASKAADIPGITITAPGRRFAIAAPHGAGLHGLPFANPAATGPAAPVRSLAPLPRARKRGRDRQ